MSKKQNRKVYISLAKTSEINARTDSAVEILKEILIKNNFSITTEELDFENADADNQLQTSEYFVVAILDRNYLTSHKKINELKHLLNLASKSNKVAFICLDDARVYSMAGMVEILDIWKTKKNQQNQDKQKNIDTTSPTDEDCDITLINNNIEFIESLDTELRNKNVLKPEIHLDSNFEYITKLFDGKIKDFSSLKPEKKQNKLPIIIIAGIVLIGILTGAYFTFFTEKINLPKKETTAEKKIEEPTTPTDSVVIIPTEKKQKQDTTGQFAYRTKKYNETIEKADIFFAEKKYNDAKDLYSNALRLFDREYPRTQKLKCDSLMAINNKKTNEIKLKDGNVLITGGKFLMGNPEDKKKQAWVTVSSFYIDKYEVSVHKYKEYCKATGEKMPREPKWGWIDDHPIVNITWRDAEKYAEWAGKRLPTSAEWEFAARGGLISKGYKYAGSDDANEVAWFRDNANNMTHPIGTKKPNELGIYDLAGNAWEWCSDWSDDNYFAQKNMLDPTGPDDGIKKILRGGSWYSDKEYLDLHYDSKGSVNYMFTHIGFRLAWDAQKRPKKIKDGEINDAIYDAEIFSTPEEYLKDLDTLKTTYKEN